MPSSSLCRHLVRVGEQLVPVGRAEVDDASQPVDLAAHLLDHAAVVAGLERLRRDERRDAGLAEDVLQLVGAVAGVDVDEDRADLGGGELHQGPLRAVGRPDADPVTGPHPDGQQSASEPVDVSLQRGIRPSPALGHVDEGLAVAEASHRLVEVVADRLLDEGRLGLTARVRQRRVEDVERSVGHRGLSGVQQRTFGGRVSPHPTPRPPAAQGTRTVLLPTPRDAEGEPLRWPRAGVRRGGSRRRGPAPANRGRRRSAGPT